MAKPTLTWYKTAFKSGLIDARGEGLKLGGQTQVEIVDIEQCRDTTRRSALSPYDRITITATVKLTVTSAVERLKCAGCDAVSPWPDDHDALWYIVENHDGDRILFPRPCTQEDRLEDGDDAGRDQYPVIGWKEIRDKTYCAECAVEVDEALAAVGAKRKRFRELTAK